MISRIYLSLFFLLACITALSQSASVKGVICEMGNPVDLGHVYLKLSLKGTVTNESGSFELFYSIQEDRCDTLVVSCLGYETRYMVLKGLATDTLHRFEMVPLPFELGEVVVLPPGLTPELIVKKAYKNMRKNFPNNPYYMEGFYRRAGYVGKQYGRVVEAAVGVKVNDRYFDKNNDELALFQVRSSNDNMEGQSLLMKLADKAMGLLTGNNVNNEFYDVLSYNWPDVFCSENESIFKFYRHEIERVLINEDKSKTYVVSYKNDNGVIRGRYHINSKSYAIHKHYFELFSTKTKFYDNVPFSNEVTFQEIDSKMYPLFIKEKALGGMEQHYKTTDTNGNEIGQYHITTLVVNYVDPKFRKHRKDFKAHLLPREEYFDASKYPYHPEFWKTYNLLQLDPQDKKMIEDLSKNMPLEQQFMKNGKQ
jgi:hypothetical protein